MNREELNAAAAEYQTPFYIFDADQLADRVQQIRERLDRRIGLCFAMKANPFLTSAMARLVDRIEVCSPGEMRICIRQNIPPDRILMSGVNKHAEDIQEALDYGVRSFTAESVKHMRLLSKAASQNGISVRVWPRLSAGSQFGMSADDIASILRDPALRENCHLAGLHYFTGTQRKAGRRQEKDMEKILSALERFEKEDGFVPEEIEYGPGLYVPYFEDEPEDDLSGMEVINDVLKALTGRYRVTVETGRYFTASCGYYLTGIDDIKSSENTNYLLVDGGIHQLNYYGGNMGLRVPRLVHLRRGSEALSRNDRQDDNTDRQEEDTLWCVCGSLCTTADVLLRAIPLSHPAQGDILVFKNTGAYSITESSAMFLCRDMPQVVIKENGRLRLARPAIDSSLLITGQ